MLEEIKLPIRNNLVVFDDKFKASLKSSVLLLDKITNYILKTKGKQIRPMFVFLSAGMHGSINESSYRAAALIELLHTATLIHDDVVDDSNIRRGFLSIKAVWKNKISVLIGDYLLSKGLLLAMENDDYDLLKIVSNAVKEMSEGELLQIQKSRTFDITEEVYFKIIKKKTASLIASCLACGTASVQKKPETIQIMHEIGENIGIAFQIKDDLLDFERADVTGKPKGVDIKEQKITLPFIYLLNNSSFFEKRKYIYQIKNNNKNTKKVEELMKQIIDKGGVEYSTKKMKEYRQKALDSLMKFPDSEYKKSLEKLIFFTTDRVS